MPLQFAIFLIVWLDCNQLRTYDCLLTVNSREEVPYGQPNVSQVVQETS